MAFRKSRFRGKSFARRRPSRYELAQISLCRVAMPLGLSACTVPDQFFHHIVSFREWMAPPSLVAGAGVTTINNLVSHTGKSITVRGIQFDYQYSCVMPIGTSESAAVGVTGIRSALVVLKVAGQGSGGQGDPTLPFQPPSNILHYTQTARANTQEGVFSGSLTETFPRVRCLWRGLDMMGQEIVVPTPADLGTLFRISQASTPFRQTQSRHVRVRTSARLDWDEGLFLVTEVVNPFQFDNPTIAVDLLGSLVVKTNWTGPQQYQTSAG